MSNSINSLAQINKNKNRKNVINKTVKTRRKNNKKRSIVDEIRERRPVPNPWRVGEVAQIIIKGNPDLKGRSGQWCIIEEVLNFSCLVKTWDGIIQVKLENLKDVYYSSQQQQEIRNISDRLAQIPQNKLEDSVKHFLEALGKIDRPFLTTLEDKILTLIETES
ncbi:hypothetical protein WH8501_15915 [Crocosphaera watsonii WH 8501]|uniref:Benzoyl-CoA reductase/2-hydroxyglutaryl-CoA dehydratase subunit, BcrC/BadD/HgdB n=5 Tax=Crocosphaera watsonii TaxID=263511 RepID=Q4BX39_CROWT|nr:MULTISPECIES: hypothetical protein [Crocosphaera]EAM48472.1 hypothetical protein CwatDRAFT_0879 [Crocosphaera watsonii WH 8501]EHJ10232.1 hypothetical protein CWATWH0003_5016 [Crocosphaera watsonii WH 0003]MCH2246755.1 hypothetical protein [Crocosphaera sp.]NQZ62048.1 hypothetical protein [Crocosphaera sp.]CCQ51842.1 Benzoyl-CoA reductase/2-hydroxyglutaryl-CoA dehydratase subunit, BcrC/BadD/HgdB [Crocosphaera watsonii WH 8502]